MSCSFQLNRSDSASLLLVFLRTDDLLKRGLTTVAERQDACLELQKNFNCQELRYIRNVGGEVAPKDCVASIFGCGVFVALDAKRV